MNRRMDDKNTSNTNNPWGSSPVPSTSTAPPSATNPWSSDGPPSPTGSTDSTDTIKPSSSGRPFLNKIY